MSQQKVDKYKESKVNRKARMKREKRLKLLRRIGLGLVALVLVGWIGHSVYKHIEARQDSKSVEISYSAVSDYLNGLTPAEEAAE